MNRVTIAADSAEAANRASQRIGELIGQAVQENGNAILSLTGGTCARRVYVELAALDVPWQHVHVFWGDERHVPPGQCDSNFGMAHAALLGHVPIPPAQIHRMRGEHADVGVAAIEYEETLRSGFSAARRGNLTFDLMLLGLGDDGHIASIFPESPLLRLSDSAARVAGVWAPHLRASRITLTPAGLLDAKSILVVASGARKSAAIRSALEEPEDVFHYPVQLLRSAGNRVEWIIDRAAASGLTQQ